MCSDKIGHDEHVPFADAWAGVENAGSPRLRMTARRGLRLHVVLRDRSRLLGGALGPHVRVPRAAFMTGPHVAYASGK